MAIFASFLRPVWPSDLCENQRNKKKFECICNEFRRQFDETQLLTCCTFNVVTSAVPM